MPGGNNGALSPYDRRVMTVIHAAEGHTGLELYAVDRLQAPHGRRCYNSL